MCLLVTAASVPSLQPRAVWPSTGRCRFTFLSVPRLKQGRARAESSDSATALAESQEQEEHRRLQVRMELAVSPPQLHSLRGSEQSLCDWVRFMLAPQACQKCFNYLMCVQRLTLLGRELRLK